MEKIKDIIPQVIDQLSSHMSDAQTKIQTVWQSIFSENERKHVVVQGYKEGKVFVLVDTPAWLFQITMHKRKVLNHLKREIPDVQDIVFKIGKVT